MESLGAQDRAGWFIVTGASRGLGAALGREFLEAGYRVLALGRQESPLRAMGKESFPALAKLLTYPLDLLDPIATHAFGAWLLAQGLQVRCLVNNAGVCLDGGGSFNLREAGFEALSPADLERTFRTNLFGPLHMAQAVFRSMAPGGLILNVTSSMGDPALLDAGWVAYRTSQTALNALTVILAKELVDLGIQVDAVAPGWVRTDMGGEDAPVAVETAAAWIHGIIRRALADPGPSGRILTYGQ